MKPKHLADNPRYFQTTAWSEVLAVRTMDEERRREAVDLLLTKYSRPILAYLERRGCRGGDAEDLTQGFICDVLLEGSLLRRADPEHGRFRTLVLTSLDRYVTMQWRKANRRKRSPEGGVASLDAGETPPSLSDPSGTPEQAFTYAWAASVLEQVLSDVRRQCHEDGLARHWRVFERTDIEPARTNMPAAALADIASDEGIDTATKASNMAVSVRRRLRVALRQRIREFVSTDAEVDQEIREITEILSGPGQGDPA